MRDARETHGIWLYATPDQIQGRHAPAVKNVRAETGPRDRAVLKSFFMLSSFLSPFSPQAKFHSALCVKRGEPADRPERNVRQERGVSGPLRSRTVRPNATN